MQAAIIVRAFVASPGDVVAERNEASRVISEWNAAHSLDRGSIIEPVRMETHARLAQGAHPQEILNNQLLDRCDFLVAIFWSKIGSPTNTAKSGSIDEIHKFAAQKGHDNVLLFFSNRPLEIGAINETEIKALKEFKADMRDKGFYRGFDDTEQFGRQLRHQLEMVMNKFLASAAFQNEWSRLAVLNERDRMTMERERIALDVHRKQMEDLASLRQSPRR